ncbi:spermidine synthase [Quadrisphaera sp. DSM 44207]|uniref:spermidine synthase n=1 Tax=Quadrisphaera sp. DSM 44207 TaxID=1881057 RepID=UPI0008871D25|nr:hypothetical protein [Quadrisphaera sp. DSM 44207]SDQ69689.1 hypothetical protein SAMN05428996_2435 [Quadrisphaera sp. DSM 44207]
MAVWEELARADGVLGEVVLRRRDSPDGPLVELVVGGVLVMDDRDTTTERALATAALAELDGDDLHVVVGGLGLGFTAAGVLADPRVRRLLVVEVEPAVLAWVAAGLVPATAGLLDDPRARARVGDVAAVLRDLPPGRADAVLLDVDNGPGFLVSPANAPLYEVAGLREAAAALRPGGVLAVWSADAAEDAERLTARLQEAVGPARARRCVVVREGRELEYRVHLARRRV